MVTAVAATPQTAEPTLVEIVIPAATNIQVIEGLLEALRPIRDADAVNGAAWKTLVEVLEDAEDVAWLAEWRANGGEQEPTRPFEDVVKDLGLDINKLRRGI